MRSRALMRTHSVHGLRSHRPPPNGWVAITGNADTLVLPNAHNSHSFSSPGRKINGAVKGRETRTLQRSFTLIRRRRLGPGHQQLGALDEGLDLSLSDTNRPCLDSTVLPSHAMPDHLFETLNEAHRIAVHVDFSCQHLRADPRHTGLVRGTPTDH